VPKIRKVPPTGARNAGGPPIVVPPFEHTRIELTGGTAAPGYASTDGPVARIAWGDRDASADWPSRLRGHCETRLHALLVPDPCWDGAPITRDTIAGMIAENSDPLVRFRFPFDDGSKAMFDAWRSRTARPGHGGESQIAEANWCVTARWLLRAAHETNDGDQLLAIGRLIGVCESNLRFGSRRRKVQGREVTDGRAAAADIDFENRDEFVREKIRDRIRDNAKPTMKRIFSDLEGDADFQRAVQAHGGNRLSRWNIKKIWGKRDTIS
jgi:hypothetical protein